ncbi:MAG: hypothetical protein ACOZFS_14270 [Thermodesulfobacteriota bacterium]
MSCWFWVQAVAAATRSVLRWIFQDPARIPARNSNRQTQAGATEMHYGSAVLPGAMFLVAYLGEVPLLGVPACALHHPVTVLDLVLPPGRNGRSYLPGKFSAMRNCCGWPESPPSWGSARLE